MWRSVLPSHVGHADELAAKSAVEPFMAAEVATDLALRARHGTKAPDLAEAIDALRTRAGMSLSSGLKLISPRATWDQLVLPADALAQLGEAVDRLRHQPQVLDDWGFLAGRSGARGVRMLFAGPPGTGKTLSAEILAGALATDLLVVEISHIVSKWIGETEKNLAEVFDAAERSHAVLLFDEADALFGKRTEVTDAHDRYANLETAYLLTRLERFEGLAVLSTNLRQNLDPAFTRRLEFVVEFTEPGPMERQLLWQGHLPPSAPLASDVDLAELATHYPVVGGVIRNAAVAAGFLAAANGGVITRDHLVRSLRREYDKTGRAFPGLHIRQPST
jgi:SpoVK/Ycf46/Vps4 family AAA+-type ATPase